jgi:5-hydroxyisourate hydrolase
MADGVNRISTHVLDTALGRPAAAVPVRLERRERSGEWQLVGSARTDDDGRCGQLLSESRILSVGLYRLTFDTGLYFAARDADVRYPRGLYPVVEITFEVRPGETHFHIPLLLSPNGYTTYRGS